MNCDTKYFKEDPRIENTQRIEGIFEGATLTFFGYLGFEVGTALIAEAKNPQEDIP